MKFFSLQERSLFSPHDPTGVKLLTRIRLKFSHLNEDKFRHNFKNTVVAMCDCGTETETTEHFFQRCPFFVTERQKLLNNGYDKHFSSQNLNEESMIAFFYIDVISSMNMITKKFFFTQFCQPFFVFLLPFFSMLTFFPN